MAAGVNTPNADEVGQTLMPRVVVDTTRLARVATWPSGWTPGHVGGRRSRACSGPQRPSVVLKGSQVAVTVDNHVRGDFRQLGLSLAILDDEGNAREVSVGPSPQGRSTATARLPACQQGCQLQTISFGGPSALVEAMHGTRDDRVVHRRRQPGAGCPRRALAGGVLPGRYAAGVRRRPGSRTGTSRCRSTRAPRAPTPASARPTYLPSCPCCGAGPRPRRPGSRRVRRVCSQSARPAPPSPSPSAGRRAC